MRQVAEAMGGAGTAQNQDRFRHVERNDRQARGVLGPAGNPVMRHLDESLVRLIARAHAFLASLTEVADRSLGDVAQLHGTDLSSVSRILPYAFRSPAITEVTRTSPREAIWGKWC